MVKRNNCSPKPLAFSKNRSLLNQNKALLAPFTSASSRSNWKPTSSSPPWAPPGAAPRRSGKRRFFRKRENRFSKAAGCFLRNHLIDRFFPHHLLLLESHGAFKEVFGVGGVGRLRSNDQNSSDLPSWFLTQTKFYM